MQTSATIAALTTLTGTTDRGPGCGAQDFSNTGSCIPGTTGGATDAGGSLLLHPVMRATRVMTASACRALTPAPTAHALSIALIVPSLPDLAGAARPVASLRAATPNRHCSGERRLSYRLLRAFDTLGARRSGAARRGGEGRYARHVKHRLDRRPRHLVSPASLLVDRTRGGMTTDSSSSGRPSRKGSSTWSHWS